jgi:hypothetical protein
LNSIVLSGVMLAAAAYGRFSIGLTRDVVCGRSSISTMSGMKRRP